MKYKLVEKGNPSKPEEPKKWYANPVNQGLISKTQLSKDIAGRSSLTRGDISNVLDNFIDELPKYLVNGFSVSLGEFGTLRLSLSGKGAPTQETYTPDMIENVKVIFTPGVALKKELADITFEREL